MVFSTVMKVLGTIASLYSILVTIRIILTWFPNARNSEFMRHLGSITDPYLDLFRGIRFLRTENLDFTPIAALAVLSILTQIFTTAAAYGHVTVGYVLALILQAVWSFFAFFLSFLGIAMVARLIAYIARWNSLHPVWRVVDALINPVLYRTNRVIYRDRIVNFRQGLITGIIVLFALRIGGGQLIKILMRLLARLPF